MLYLSTPSSKAVRDAMSAGLIGCMTTPNQGNRIPVDAVWAADNGKFGKNYVGDQAWLSWLCRMVKRYGSDKCLFAVAPDVPFDAAATLECSRPWLAMIRALDLPAAFCAQDGAEADGMAPWDEFDVLFIAGSDKFKLGEHAKALAAEAVTRGKSVHVGRVNSHKRLLIADALGAASCDGTFLRYGPNKNLPKVLDWLGQHAAAERVRARDDLSGRDRHWHPRPSSWIGADGRIHAPEGWRTHLVHGVHCDERDCEACIHDCDCARCDPWCGCERPPNLMLPGGEMRFSNDGRLTETGLLALADEIAEALGPPWIHDQVGHHYYRTHLVSPDDGWRIAINVERGRHKAAAIGLTPTLEGRWWCDAKQASIGFTATRDPDAIAADMRRRLFPVYAKALDIERPGIEHERDRRERFAHAAARLGSHLPGHTAKDLSVRDLRFDKYWKDRHGSYNTARLSSNSRTVALDLRNLPLDVACSVIDLIEGRTGTRRRPHGADTAARRHARRSNRAAKARRP
ncbi:hypothetical protein KGQ20_04180 [Catenulispora sp. NF23]|uniref:Uncharacterized protein n=1 Tax=Catenulispora pinistramenti TaxID=2705254 RepID=A0ABS5KJT4_9ACTN|nr:hypothetical protein [Catenulispora pinistramenti]MBS2531962.1 hypothetical protein [Catenulispora pinistramenti]MBS2546230.1 hypothetical protein [Catenulispora pinistramenti]